MVLVIVIGRTHFGAAFDGLAEAKREHDTGHVPTPGCEVFQPPAPVRARSSPRSPRLYQHQRDRGRSATDVTAALTHLARAALGRLRGDRRTA